MEIKSSNLLLYIHYSNSTFATSVTITEVPDGHKYFTKLCANNCMNTNSMRTLGKVLNRR